MVDLLSTTLQIWSNGKAAVRCYNILVSYNFEMQTLLFKQLPELFEDSKSFVFFEVPLSAARFLSSGRITASSSVITIIMTQDIKASSFVDSSGSSHQEELATLEMCCSLIDTSIEENSKIDLLLDNHGIEPSNIDLLLDLLNDKAEISEVTDARLDLSNESIDWLIQRANAGKHSEDLNEEQNLASSTDASTMPSPWLSSKDDVHTISTVLTQPTQEEILSHAKSTTQRSDRPNNHTEHIVRWNSFAESNGATPRAFKENTSSYLTISGSCLPQTFYGNNSEISKTSTTGGYMTNRRRDYSIRDEDSNLCNGGSIARRRYGNRSKNATHSTASNTYVQPYVCKDSVVAKHGSLW